MVYRKTLILNLARLGNHKNGLSVFSRKVVQCLLDRAPEGELRVLISSELRKEFGLVDDDNLEIVDSPSYLSTTSHISRLRPVFWLLYSILAFPKRSRILTTTHHGIFGAKDQIITIHDLRPYFLPDSKLQRGYFKYILPRLARKAKAILTVSHTTKTAIENLYNICGDKIFVVPNYVDTDRFSPLVNNQFQGDPYLLMVGATFQHKNAHEVIEFSQAWSNRYQLKIVAGHGQYRNRLQSLVTKKGLSKNIEFVNSVDETELIRLYQNSSAFIYPSLMEGFGIPPLEAMACGIPVIVSDIEVFREILGEAPLYVKLGNSKSWDYAFEALGNRDFISKRIQIGIAKAKQYTEERMRSSLIDAISKCWPDLAGHVNG